MQHTEWICVVDFGSQYTQLIARRIRELGVYSEIHPFHGALEKISAAPPLGIILSGGPNSVYGEGAPNVEHGIFETGVPVLGICYGLQLMATHFDGAVDPAASREFGKAELVIDNADDLFRDIPQRSRVWMSHGLSLIHI